MGEIDPSYSGLEIRITNYSEMFPQKFIIKI